jgi:hypothetical protein
VSPVILLSPNPDLVRSTFEAVRARVRAAEAYGDRIRVTMPEACVLVAVMNDMYARRDQSHLMIDEPSVGMEGTVFGHPFVVVAAY